jgi:hypothetical protein
MGKTTLTVDESTHERFKKQKAALDDVQDAPDHTTDSFLNALMDTWEASGDPATLAEVAPAAFAERLVEELPDSESGGKCVFGDVPEGGFEDLQEAIATVEERTGRIEKTLEDMGGRR